MPRLWSLTATIALIAAVLAAAAMPGASGAVERRTERELIPGVRHLVIDQDGPDVMVNVARVSRGAEVDLQVVAAHDQVAGGADGGRELTSDMCRRVGGLVCINGDFAECPTCGQPIGGLVRAGRVLRSFHSAHEQLSVLDTGALTTEDPAWSGRLVATYTWPEKQSKREELLGEDPGQRTETRTLTLDALNRSRPDGTTVLFTPEWAPTTGAEGGFEAVLGTAEGVRAGSMPVTWRGGDDGDAAIPIDGVVVSASGSEAPALRGFFDEWQSSDADSRSLHLETALTPGVAVSIGAHPVLLRAGVPQPLDNEDNKVTARHPRTLAGWTSDGELLLVTVDGRKEGHSQGMTLYEATDLMARLGASDAVNLDGGGSSTFAGPCDAGTCVLNRPSDNSERHVTTALAVIPRRPGLRAATSAPPPAPVAPPPAPAVPEAPAVAVASTAAADAAPGAETEPVSDAGAVVAPAEPVALDDAAAAGPDYPVALPSFRVTATEQALAAPVESPLRPLSALAIIGVLANVAGMGWLQRRRLVPVLVAAVAGPVSARSGPT